MKPFLIAIFFFFGTVVQSQSLKPRADFTVSDEETRKAIEDCEIIENGSVAESTNSQGKCSLFRGEGPHTAIFSNPAYLKRRVTYRTVDGTTEKYTVELTSLATINKIKGDIENRIRERGLGGHKKINPLLEELHSIYGKNGYPELYDQYKSQLRISGNADSGQ